MEEHYEYLWAQVCTNRACTFGRELFDGFQERGGIERTLSFHRTSRFRIHSASRSSPARLSNLVSTRWHSQGQWGEIEHVARSKTKKKTNTTTPKVRGRNADGRVGTYVVASTCLSPLHVQAPPRGDMYLACTSTIRPCYPLAPSSYPVAARRHERALPRPQIEAPKKKRCVAFFSLRTSPRFASFLRSPPLLLLLPPLLLAILLSCSSFSVVAKSNGASKAKGKRGKEGRRRGEEGKAKRDKKDATETGKRNGETKRVWSEGEETRNEGKMEEYPKAV